MRQPTFIATCVAAGLLSACAAPGDSEDGANDSIVSGKADSAYTDAELAGALRAANELSYEELDEAVALSSRVAANIVEARPYAAIDDLDAVPYVGSVVFAALVDYAREAGWTDALPALSKAGAGGLHVAVTAEHLATLTNGSPHVMTYERTGAAWSQGATLQIPGSVYGFTQSLAMDGDTLAVTGNAGTPTAPDYHTYVFAYGANGWTQTQVLDGGGSALALDNDTLVIGDGVTLGPVANRVRIYRQAAGTFQEVATLNGDSAFGQQLALRDDVLVVGTVSSGAYVLDLAAGPPSVSAMVRLDTGASQSIAVTRERIAIGSSGRGSVDVFEHSDKGWALAAHIVAPPALGSEYPLFGMTVALDADHVVVGAPRTSTTLDPDASVEGAVYVYDAAGALLERRLGPSAKSFFGTSLAINDGIYAVGGLSAVYTN